MLRSALLNIGLNASFELVLEGTLLLLLAVNDCPNGVPTDDLGTVRVERDLGHRLHSAASKGFGFLLVTGAKLHEVLSRHGAESAQNLTLFIRGICAILANFGHAGIIPALESRLEMVVALALLLLLGLGGRRSFLLFAFFLHVLGGALVVFAVTLAHQFLEKGLHFCCFHKSYRLIYKYI